MYPFPLKQITRELTVIVSDKLMGVHTVGIQWTRAVIIVKYSQNFSVASVNGVCVCGIIDDEKRMEKENGKTTK